MFEKVFTLCAFPMHVFVPKSFSVHSCTSIPSFCLLANPLHARSPICFCTKSPSLSLFLAVVVSVADVQSKPSSPALDPPAPVMRRKERPQVLNLSDGELAGVLRPRPGRLDSPSNRYAGDWSDCKETYLHQTCPEEEEEADYADVPSEEEKDEGEEKERREEEDEVPEGGTDVQIDVENEQKSDVKEHVIVGEQQEMADPPLLMSCDRMLVERGEHRVKEHTYQAFMKIQEISPVLSNRVNLRDLQESIDALIGNLERELNKNKLNVGY